METTERKLIDYRVYDPGNSLFGSKKSDKARFTELHCSNSSECGAFKNNSCPMWNITGERCPYGTRRVSQGFTRRARKFHLWIESKRALVKGIKQLDGCKKICRIGEYIYFPYPFWSLDRSIAVKQREGLFVKGQEFFKLEDFTSEFFEKILHARPHAMMGGEISSYQKEVVPKIVTHTEEELPLFFDAWKNEYPETAKKYEKKDYVGRKAYLKTVKPGSVFKHSDGIMVWNGFKLCIEDYDGIFLPINDSVKASLTVIPKDKSTIEIESNDQVDEHTKFLD